jgi:hypothetical protein
MPKFIVVVENDRGRWEEEYDKLVADPRKWAEETVARFNATLYPKELPRRLVDVILVGDSEQHDWHKINLVTVSDHLGRLYDILRCKRCGVTAKRFGLEDIRRDRQFKAKKYAKCKGCDSITGAAPAADCPESPQPISHKRQKGK